MKCPCTRTKEEAKCTDPPNKLLKSIKVVELTKINLQSFQMPSMQCIKIKLKNQS